ncbi:hypothetical protein V6N13_137318 [Hibiscus sabdariffa]
MGIAFNSSAGSFFGIHLECYFRLCAFWFLTNIFYKVCGVPPAYRATKTSEAISSDGQLVTSYSESLLALLTS